MKRILIVLGLVIVLGVQGCATPSSMRIIPVRGDGAAVVVDVGADAVPGFWSQNWGKVLTGSIAAGGLYMMADHNGWLSGGGGDESTPTVKTPNEPAMGDGNAVVVGNSGSVSINIGNSEAP